jgi:hypothetical protein
MNRLADLELELPQQQWIDQDRNRAPLPVEQETSSLSGREVGQQLQACQ